MLTLLVFRLVYLFVDFCDVFDHVRPTTPNNDMRYWYPQEKHVASHSKHECWFVIYWFSLGCSTFYMSFFRNKHKHVPAIYIIPPHWHDIGSWNPAPCNTRAHLFYIANMTSSISWLLMTRNQQPWYWSSYTRITRNLHRDNTGDNAVLH